MVFLDGSPACPIHPHPERGGGLRDLACAPQARARALLTADVHPSHAPVFENISRAGVFNPLADLLGQPDEDPFRASDVTEPVLVLVLRQFTNQLGSVRAEPGERIVDVLHGEHDA
jgi:hypothetical protein